MLDLLGVVRPRWPHLALGRSRQAGLDILATSSSRTYDTAQSELHIDPPYGAVRPRRDAVPDVIWDEAADHYDEQGLAGVILMIAVTNFFNRLNATVKEPAGATWT